MTVSRERRDELAANLSTVRDRILRAADGAGRDPADVTLVVVTKTWPASDIRLLAELGVKEVGENRDQEAAPKAAQLADLDLVWHFIGQLQTNKARSVARYADVVESIDRVRLVNAMDKAAEQAGRRLSALAQVVFDDRPGRGGATDAELAELVSAIDLAQWLDLAGVMAVAPLGVDPTPSFRQLARIGQALQSTHPSATVISAGMSSDLEEAIRCGATHVRVGSAVLGHRPPVG